MKTAAMAVLLSLAVSPAAASCPCCGTTVYVSPKGTDRPDFGTLSRPLATFDFACSKLPRTGGTVFALDGDYLGTQVITGRFTRPAVFRALNPYRARLVSSDKRHRVLEIYKAENVIVDGFEMIGAPSSHDEHLIHLSSRTARRIMIRNNIIHDGYNNDLVKVSDGASLIAIRGNVFYNQPCGAEGTGDVKDTAMGIAEDNSHVTGCGHLAIDTVSDVFVLENIFFNDGDGSGRENRNNTRPYIAIKNSGSRFGTRHLTVARNVFMNWEGLPDQPMLLVDEDRKPFLEAENVMVENNLFLLSSGNPGAGALGIKGARRIVFRSNTVSGDQPHGDFGFAARISREGKNRVNEDISFWNNVWSSPGGNLAPFSAGRPEDTKGAVLKNNLYWNGGKPVPRDGRVLEPAADPNAVNADPRLAPPRGVVLPRWNPAAVRFASGSGTIRQEFERLVNLYAAPREGSPAIGAADPEQSPADDILGRKRAEGGKPDLGCFETLKR